MGDNDDVGVPPVAAVPTITCSCDDVDPPMGLCWCFDRDVPLSFLLCASHRATTRWPFGVMRAPIRTSSRVRLQIHPALPVDSHPSHVQSSAISHNILPDLWIHGVYGWCTWRRTRVPGRRPAALWLLGFASWRCRRWRAVAYACLVLSIPEGILSVCGNCYIYLARRLPTSDMCR